MMLVEVLQSVALVGIGAAVVVLSLRSIRDRERLAEACRDARWASSSLTELRNERNVERRRMLRRERRSARWLFRQWLVGRGWSKPRDSDLPTFYDGRWS